MSFHQACAINAADRLANNAKQLLCAWAASGTLSRERIDSLVAHIQAYETEAAVAKADAMTPKVVAPTSWEKAADEAFRSGAPYTMVSPWMGHLGPIYRESRQAYEALYKSMVRT